MAVFFVLVFLAGVGCTLTLRAWLKAAEEAAKARIAREERQHTKAEPVEEPKRRRRGK